MKNVEIKARCRNQNHIREVLSQHGADYKGTDHQIDTYFRVNNGRLKLREGTIENSLIYYQRPNSASPKQSNINLAKLQKTEALKDVLTAALPVWVTVDKQREIYFIDNVKFHIDEVQQLGSFVEIEAIDENNSINAEKLHEQCNRYMQLFDISEQDLIAESYSDLLAAQL